MTEHSGDMNRLASILDRLLDMSPEERDTTLNSLARSAPHLAERARALLVLAQDDTSFPSNVEAAAPNLLADLMSAGARARIGERVGPYELVECAGQGGMGAVFRAERVEGGFDQTVAVKVLNIAISESHSRIVFERERAYLARLEHPNIARFIDAGYTDDGAPCIVMEFIDGEAIDRHRERSGRRTLLELFFQLCDAVAYCHRNLLVHGDIKPSNILVQDDRIRLLDFGIGRLIERGSAEHVWGYSPSFTAPERLRGEPLTIQSDIYSLGKVLAQLLEGTSLESSRRTGLPKDLQAIIDRATADPAQARYGSVHALREDLERYLGVYPVAARKAGAAYRARRFIQRQRLLVGATAAIVLAVSSGLVVALWQYETARTDAAHARAVTNFLVSLFDRAHPDIAGERDITLREIIDEAAERAPAELARIPEVRAEVSQLLGTAYRGLGEFEEALALHRAVLSYWEGRVASPHPKLVQSLNNVGSALYQHGKSREAMGLHRRALEQLAALDMGSTELAAETWTRLGRASMRIDATEAARGMQAAYDIRMALDPDDEKTKARGLANIATASRANGKPREAILLSEQALALAEKAGERMSPSIVNIRCNIALDYMALGRLDKARPLLQACVQDKIERLGPGHVELVSAYNNLGVADLAIGRPGEARDTLAKATALAERHLPERELSRMAARINYAVALWQLGQPQQALSQLEPIRVGVENVFGDRHPATFRVRTIQGRVVLDLGQAERAEALIERSMERLKPRWRGDALLWLAEAKLALYKNDEAAQLASESLRLRREVPAFQPWSIAIAEYILARARQEPARRARIERELSTLPPDHIRHPANVVAARQTPLSDY